MRTDKDPSLSLLMEDLFSILNEKKYNYCICGNYESLPFYTDNDVDLWCDEPEEVIKIIENICLKINYTIYLKNSNATGSNIFISLDDRQPLTIIHIDILKECRWYSFLPLVRCELIKRHRKIYKNFYVANEIIDAAMHFMYPLSYFGIVTPKYYDDIKKASADSDFWAILNDGWGQSFCKKIQPLLIDGNWKSVEREFAVNRSILILRLIRKLRWPEFRSLYYFIGSNIHRLLKPSGLFIAFVGPDGCGKTTVQSNLQLFFEKGFTKGKIKKFYWRPFFFPRLKSLINIGRDCDSNDDIDPSDRLELRESSLDKRFLHCIKLFYYWMDYILGRVKYQGTWSRGGVVCFDRYWDDLIVFPERFGLNTPKWLVQILGFAVPKPDIVFYLHAEPAVLIGRKQELPFDEMKKQVDHYKKLAEKKDNFEIIDGSRSQDEVLKDVVETCINKMAERHLAGKR